MKVQYHGWRHCSTAIQRNTDFMTHWTPASWLDFISVHVPFFVPLNRSGNITTVICLQLVNIISIYCYLCLNQSTLYFPQKASHGCFDICEPILLISTRNVTEKVTDQMVLCFPTSPSYCTWTTFFKKWNPAIASVHLGAACFLPRNTPNSFKLSNCMHETRSQKAHSMLSQINICQVCHCVVRVGCWECWVQNQSNAL